MQDLSSIPDASAPTYQDPLYLEDQVPRRRPPIGYRAGDSDTEDECWSDTEAALPSWLLLLVNGQGQVLPGPCTETTYNVPKQAGPGFYLLPFSFLYLRRGGTRALPKPLRMKPKPTQLCSFLPVLQST
uniref:Receptor accessory protein 4 n=1 Tax=Rousettus aegyptiacus TaxID=9407 RepID=A0A7J8BTU8_ROUAE|nr:receptor accessory protein 4 [Rousettus aegyptiacus]